MTKQVIFKTDASLDDIMQVLIGLSMTELSITEVNLNSSNAQLESMKAMKAEKWAIS